MTTQQRLDFFIGPLFERTAVTQDRVNVEAFRRRGRFNAIEVQGECVFAIQFIVGLLTVGTEGGHNKLEHFGTETSRRDLFEVDAF